MDKKAFLEFMRGYDLCVLSTVNTKGNPESALVGFSESDTFELLVGTTNSSRKYANIIANPNVSVAIGWNEGICVQYEGIARVLTQGKELERRLQNHFVKLPGAQQYRNQVEQCYIVLKPKWLRYTDTNQSPRYIQEIIF